MNSPIFFVFIGLISLTAAYSIEGQWSIVNIGNFNVPSQYNLTLDVSDYIFRNSSIRWSFSFEGCQSLKYVVEIDQNHLFIDIDTLYKEIGKKTNCSPKQIEEQRSLENQIKKVFTFQIISQYMTFSDAKGNVLLKFQRNNKYFSVQPIIGVWSLRGLYDDRFNQIIQINQTHIIFCQKKAFLEYKLLTTPFAQEINVANLVDQGCGFKLFAQALTKAQFLRPLRNLNSQNVTQIYDKEDKLITTLYYVTDLQTAEQLKEEQRILKQKLEQQRQARIQQLRQIQWQRQISQQQRPAPQQTVIQVVKQLTNSIEDIQGEWEIKSVFRIPSFIKDLSLVITSSNMILSGGCNTHIIMYQQGQINNQIDIGALRSTKRFCQVDDDGLFVNGLSKIKKYDVLISQRLVIAKFFDKQGKQVFQLNKPVQYQTLIVREDPAPPSVSRPPTPIINRPPPSPPAPIPTGRYLILLLKRRDLPRKFSNIDYDKKQIKFQVCNQMKFQFSVSDQKLKISFIDKIETNEAECSQKSLDQEKLFIEYLQSAETFKSEGNGFIVSNKQEGEIVAFNSF